MCHVCHYLVMYVSNLCVRVIDKHEHNKVGVSVTWACDASIEKSTELMNLCKYSDLFHCIHVLLRF